MIISMQRRHWLIQPSYESSALQSGLVLFTLNSLSDFTPNLRTSWARRFWSLIRKWGEADRLVKHYRTSSFMLCFKSLTGYKVILARITLIKYTVYEALHFKCSMQLSIFIWKMCVFDFMFPIAVCVTSGAKLKIQI